MMRDSGTESLSPIARTVRDEWIDYNGHLNEAYYVLLFSEAIDAAMDELGLGPRYRDTSGCSLFTVESHIRYLDQILPRSTVSITTTVIGAGEKKLVTWHEMSVDGTLRATEEVLGLHVDVSAGRSTPFPGHVQELLRSHREPAPSAAGRSIRLGPGDL